VWGAAFCPRSSIATTPSLLQRTVRGTADQSQRFIGGKCLRKFHGTCVTDDVAANIDLRELEAIRTMERNVPCESAHRSRVSARPAKTRTSLSE